MYITVEQVQQQLKNSNLQPFEVQQFNIQKWIDCDGQEKWECEFFDSDGEWEKAVLWCSRKFAQEVACAKTDEELNKLIDYSLWEENWTMFRIHNGIHYIKRDLLSIAENGGLDDLSSAQRAYIESHSELMKIYEGEENSLYNEGE